MLNKTKRKKNPLELLKRVCKYFELHHNISSSPECKGKNDGDVN